MNLEKLRKAEKIFLKKFPGGFQNPEMIQMAKKHKMEKLTEMSHELFKKSNFTKTDETCDNIIKFIGRSTLVSLFEKPKIKDFVNSAPDSIRSDFVKAFESLLHGKMQKGFEQIVAILEEGKLAKWSLVSVLPVYYRPTEEVFVKPTTAKNIIEIFELEKLTYKPKPAWEFYTEYRKQINEMKKQVNPSLSPSSPAFTGFLWMTMDEMGAN